MKIMRVPYVSVIFDSNVATYGGGGAIWHNSLGPLNVGK